MRIDAHQHFWDIQRFQYPWMPAGESLLWMNADRRAGELLDNRFQYQRMLAGASGF